MRERLSQVLDRFHDSSRAVSFLKRESVLELYQTLIKYDKAF